MIRRLRLSPVEVGLVGGAIAVLALAPLFVGESDLSRILTRALFLGIIAVSLTFLSGYGGMLSLGQAAIFGIAGFTMANLVASDGGRDLTWNPWLGMVVGIVVATGVAFLFGLVSARSEGIYFLMITLAFGILTFYFFGQVNDLAGFGGLNNVDRPATSGTRVRSRILSTTRRSSSRSSSTCCCATSCGRPSGSACRGSETIPRGCGRSATPCRSTAPSPSRSPDSSPLSAGSSSSGGTSRSRPGSMGLAAAINILIIAIIGGIFHLEGAWVGAFVFVLIDNYSRSDNVVFGDFLHAAPDRFNTVIGGLFLLIVLLSPGGIIGIGTSLSAPSRKQHDPRLTGGAAHRAGGHTGCHLTPTSPPPS